MIQQLAFIKIIMDMPHQADSIYAADILLTLHRSKTGIKLPEIMEFFRSGNKCKVFETVMSLIDKKLITAESTERNSKFTITAKGEEKVQMINACMNLVRLTGVEPAAFRVGVERSIH